MNDDEVEKPWNEEQWETFLKRADAKAARFGELLETFRDDPDRSEKIATEMGWAHIGEPNDDTDAAGIGDACDEPLPDREKRSRAKRIPELAIVRNARRQFFRELGELSRDDDEPRFATAMMSPALLETALIRGDGMGDEDDVICGQIVVLKLSLIDGRRGREAMHSLADEGRYDRERARVLLELLDAAIGVVHARIERLRRNVWWT